MGLIITDASGADVAEVASFALDMAFGSGENDFEVSGLAVRLSRGSLIYIDGTEYGGIVDMERIYTDRYGAHLAYSGRTWHGILAQAIVKPPAGQSHLTVSGSAEGVIATVLANCGQTALFEADSSASGITIASTQVPRYINAYEALQGILATQNARLAMSKQPSGKVVLSAVLSATVSNEVDDDIITFDLSQALTNVNHLVCLGEGEGASRTVLDIYADIQGNVSTTQSIVGKYERTEVYEAAGDDATALLADGTAKLKELQGDGEVSVDISQGLDVGIGDSVEARNNEFGITIIATVTKKVITHERGVLSVRYEVGTPSSWAEQYD